MSCLCGTFLFAERKCTAGTEELLPDDTHGIVLPGQPQDATVETIRAGLQTLLDDPARAHACAAFLVKLQEPDPKTL